MGPENGPENNQKEELGSARNGITESGNSMCKGCEADGNVRNSKQLARLDPENKRQEWQLQGPMTGAMEI